MAKCKTLLPYDYFKADIISMTHWQKMLQWSHLVLAVIKIHIQ